LPARWSRNHLPLGLQLVGRWKHDLELLRVAKWAERRLRWRSHPIDFP
jgi:Asp-tRNA(Asn)/Glu-tRNA(Gln) amidotransferase A subunit family amidase